MVKIKIKINIKGKGILISGITCFLYFLAITIFIGYLNIFNTIWIFIGIFCVIIYKQKEKIKNYYRKSPKILKLLFLAAVIVFLLSFVIIECLIINSSRNRNTESARYVVLLGAGLNGSEPSRTLSQRINAAIKYLNENRNVMVIVSGGKGPHETFTEAEIMSRILLSNNIEMSRVIIEDRSKNTYENLTYSGKLIDIDKKVIIITSGFHMFRARSIAKKIGYKNIGCVTSKTPILLLPNYYTREYFAVLKEFIINRI